MYTMHVSEHERKSWQMFYEVENGFNMFVRPYFIMTASHDKLIIDPIMCYNTCCSYFTKQRNTFVIRLKVSCYSMRHCVILGEKIFLKIMGM